MPTVSTRVRAAVAASAALTVGLVIAAPVSGATAARDPGGPAPEWKVVAEGLDNPRQLSFFRDTLFVAESGVGGAGPCIPTPEGEGCFGLSGAITKVHHGRQSRVLEGLPSIAGADGSAASGPSDVSVTGFVRYAVTIGLGADPAVRASLPPEGQLLGTLVKGQFGHGGARLAADLAAHEAATDPDGAGPDSNPTSLVRTPFGKVSTDAGGNSLVFNQGSRVRMLAVFDSPGTAPAPFPPFDPIPMQSVPTSVAIGPDGAFYVSELTGFPFAPGAARIHRVVPGQAPTVYATGLTNVTDLAWSGGKLYAVQIADAGLASGGDPIGSLVRVVPGGAPQTVAGGLFAPYGLAIQRGSAYVTVCSLCADAGSVIKVPLG